MDWLNRAFPKHELPEWVEVRQSGKLMGYLPGSFSPALGRTTSFLYDMRPGDLVDRGGLWDAHQSLGFGDLLAIEGFQPA